MRLRFFATPEKQSHLAEDIRVWNEGVADVSLKRAKQLLKSYPRNFFPEGKSPEFTQRKAKHEPGKYNLGIFMGGVPNYVSGGRYHTWLFANALASIFNTTIITSFNPEVYSQNIYSPKLKVLVDKNYALKWGRNPFDFLLAPPVHEGITAAKYARKWGIPFYLMLLEPPNFTRKYRSGADTTEEYWVQYKRCMAEAEKIIFSCKTTAEYGKKWGIDPKKIAIVYPPFNQEACEKVPEQKETHEIVWISRAIGFKRPGDAAAIAQRYGLTVNFISSRTHGLRKLAQEKGVKANFYSGVTDLEKFKIIKRCKFMVHSSLFEGFGMPPGEALLCKKPCIVYDYPTFREIYKDKLEYARYKDQSHLIQLAGKLMRDSKYRRKRGEEGYKFIKGLSSFDRVRKDFLKIMPPIRIGFFMIVFEGADYLEANLRQIYPHAHQILIAEGAVELMAKIKGYFRSRDETVRIINKFSDPEHKIRLLQVDRPWKNKVEMKNELLKHLKAEILWQVDVDEFYTHGHIERIRENFRKDKSLDVATFTALHFWKDLDHYRWDGGRWKTKNLRVFRRRGKISFRFHGFPDRDGKPYSAKYFKAKDFGTIRFHYGYVRSRQKIEDKIKFMCLRDPKLAESYRKNLEEWLRGKVKLEEFKGKHPKAMQNVIKRSNK